MILIQILLLLLLLLLLPHQKPLLSPPSPNSKRTMSFSHEKLVVYQRSIAFVAWAKRLQEQMPKGTHTIRNQLDRASISVPLNIAEGNAKRSYADRARILQIAQGSATECAACLDVMVAQNLTEASEIADGKRALEQIVGMLFKLIERCRSELSVGEDPPGYGAPLGLLREWEQEQEQEQGEAGKE